MFQQSRRRFLAGFAVLGVGGSLLGRAAMAQTATSFQCEIPLTNKAVTGLKASTAKGGVYQDLMFGKMNRNADVFGQQSEIKLVGTVGKLAKGITPTGASKQSILTLSYFRTQRKGEETLSINIDLQPFHLGELYDGYVTKAKLEIPAFKDLKTFNSTGPSSDNRVFLPSASARFAAPWGTIKTKLPKSSDFSAKITVDGKAIIEVKFPKLALAKILDALDKEHRASAEKYVVDPSLAGDLSSAPLPKGCSVIKPSSGGTGRLCYLTTAAVNVVGLPDDCWELKQLRAFRDRFAATGDSAAAAMADYYDHAPTVVENINRRSDAQRIWLRTYWASIVPAAIASRIGFDALAQRIYFRLVHKLKSLASI